MLRFGGAILTTWARFEEHAPRTNLSGDDQSEGLFRVVFFGTGWSSGKGGVSTINRDLAKAVARLPDTDVWCLLPYPPSSDEAEDAHQAQVWLRHAEKQAVPEDNELFLLTGPMNVPASTTGHAADDPFELGVDAVVGHGRWTGPAALRMAREKGVSIRAHIVHVDPSTVERHKDRELSAGERADRNLITERELCVGPGVAVFGVGPRLTHTYLRHGEGIEAHELVPGFLHQPLPNPGRARRVLLIGRLEDADLKGVEVALSGLLVLAREERIEFELRGARDITRTEQRVRDYIDALAGDDAVARNRLKVSVTAYSTEPTRLEESFRQASVVLMPSRDEGFGLVGLEALARNRPVLVSRHSGLADLIKRECGADHPLAEHFIVDPDDESDVARGVQLVMSDLEGARKAVSDLRSLLSSKCDWDLTAQEFLRVLRSDKAGSTGSSNARDAPAPGFWPAERGVQGYSGLEVWPRKIGGVWVERPEAKQLWKEVTQPDTRLVVMLGAPGSGKSALLADLATKLRERGAPVVTLKADQVPVAVRTEADLCAWMGVPGRSLASALERLAEDAATTTLLVDQLDALASLVDLNTGRLHLILEVLARACSTPGVRVVASMRELESRYDPSLRRLRSGSGQLSRPSEITVGSLPEQGVRELWAKTTGGALDDVPSHLRRPHILKLAVKLGQPLTSATAVTETYWRQQVMNAPASARKALFELEQEMERGEVFWVPVPTAESALDHWFGPDGLLVTTGESPPRVGFSHQVLFEEARAERWLDTYGLGGLTGWVAERLDTLTYRPKLRAVMERIRTSRAADYPAIWRELWDLGAERRNLRELLVVHLGQSEAPAPAEAKLLREVLAGPDYELRAVAVGTIAGRARWFGALRQWIPSLLEEEAAWLRGYLGSLWEVAPHELDEWLARWVTLPTRQEDALWVLSRREIWSDTGFELLRRLVRLRVDDDLVHHIARRMKRAEDRGRLLELAVTYAQECWGSPDPDDPYQAPPGFPWDEAASVDPLVFVTRLLVPLGAVAQVAAREHHIESRFGFDAHAWKSGRDFAHETILGAFRRALPKAVAAAGGRLEFLASLETVDNEEIQKMLLAAYAANASEITEHALQFLLSDVRRIVVGRAGADLVAALGPHLSDSQRDLLQAAIHQATSVKRSTEGDPESDGRLEAHRARFRSVLQAMASGDTPLNVAEEDLLESLEPRIRGGFVGAPHSPAELVEMTDEDLLATIVYYDGRDTDWSSGDPVGGERGLGRSLEGWASQQPARALATIDELLARVENGKDRTPKYRTALISSLRGVSNAEQAMGDSVEESLLRFLRAGVFEGADSTAKEARWEAASRLIPWLRDEAQEISEELYDALVEWAAVDADELEPQPEAPRDGKPLLEHAGLTIVPRGSYPALRALAMLYVNGGQVDWDGLLPCFERLAHVADVRSWRTLLGEITWRPAAEFKERWFAFVDDLLSRRPTILAHRNGAHVVRHLMWEAPPVLMEKWLAAVRTSDWDLAERFATEMETLMVAVDQHVGWAEPKLEARLAVLESAVEVSEQERLGLALGLAFLWSHSDLRARVSEWAERLVAHAPVAQAVAFIGAIRFAPAEPVPSLLRFIREAARRDLAWPDLDRSAHSIAGALVSLADTHSEEVADAAEWLLRHDLRGRGGLEDLTIIAFHLTRQPEPKLQRRGMEIFELVLATGGWFARRALDLVDGHASVD